MSKAVDVAYAAIRDGIVTCLGDDHLDYDLSDKQPNGADRFNNIFGCNAGMPGGMEHLLPVLVTAGVRTGRISMEDVVRVCATNTARLMGLYPRKGVLAVGSDADVVVVDPERHRTVDDGFYHTRVRDWSLYWGWTLYGIPSTTLVRGTVVLEDGETVGLPGHGRSARSRPTSACATAESPPSPIGSTPHRPMRSWTPRVSWCFPVRSTRTSTSGSTGPSRRTHGARRARRWWAARPR